MIGNDDNGIDMQLADVGINVIGTSSVLRSRDQLEEIEEAREQVRVLDLWQRSFEDEKCTEIPDVDESFSSVNTSSTVRANETGCMDVPSRVCSAVWEVIFSACGQADVEELGLLDAFYMAWFSLSDSRKNELSDKYGKEGINLEGTALARWMDPDEEEFLDSEERNLLATLPPSNLLRECMSLLEMPFGRRVFLKTRPSSVVNEFDEDNDVGGSWLKNEGEAYNEFEDGGKGELDKSSWKVNVLEKLLQEFKDKGQYDCYLEVKDKVMELVNSQELIVNELDEGVERLTKLMVEITSLQDRLFIESKMFKSLLKDVYDDSSGSFEYSDDDIEDNHFEEEAMLKEHSDEEDEYSYLENENCVVEVGSSTESYENEDEMKCSFASKDNVKGDLKYNPASDALGNEDSKDEFVLDDIEDDELKESDGNKLEVKSGLSD